MSAERALSQADHGRGLVLVCLGHGDKQTVLAAPVPFGLIPLRSNFRWQEREHRTCHRKPRPPHNLSIAYTLHHGSKATGVRRPVGHAPPAPSATEAPCAQTKSTRDQPMLGCHVFSTGYVPFPTALDRPSWTILLRA